MGKRLNYKGKLNILLITYAFFITMIVLILGFILINKIDKPISNINSYFISYSQAEISTAITQGSVSTKIAELPAKVITNSDMQKTYNKEIISNGMVVMLVVFAIVMVISILISKFISRKVIYPIEKIACSLPDIINGNIDEIDENIFEGELSGVGSALAKSSQKIKMLLKEANSINSYISHEQKNTLAILRAKIQLGERDELIGLIDKMSCSLDDILALNATEDIKYDEEVDLGLVCAEAVDIYSKVYNNIELKIDEEEIPTIKSREIWIYRAVCNLIENAIKYGDNSKIIVKAYNKNGSAIICVEDGGKGIDKEIIDKIFNFEYRGGNLKKDGYGIGLSLVYQITNLSEGITFVDSESGKGAKFYMAFKAL
ncbi:HAMP domain-containing histidine kinase [Clostridium gasigenes]|uniref:histidine kinase n=1 Tax=Clostridium gasigenes TaxID=94869 RepID=A0A7X0V5Z8_9CLOT|nr:HAMP domain-containing sensor histidine kinase [Clostridium gasigenes]MBB6622811.1 HAMP domain-containing histidine kinase [Clostridium gasigenes]MBB6714423.1 HAMP domain-containing histidine kinase [Clostridium gasigenes]NKF06192.1 HAMP domain-containing histidine kinase [Clostridium gasigenes]QSW20079.1 HAMP domain-containing histidine kinase [Clostridium gasigenes]